MTDQSRSPVWQSGRTTNVSAQLQNLQNILRNEQQRETVEQEISLRSNILERQRRELHAQWLGRDAQTIPEIPPTDTSLSSLVRSRRRAFRPSERLQRQRERRAQTVRANASDPLENQQRETPPPAFPESAGDSYDAESQFNREQRFRAKRRKLDDGTFDDETRVISYGDEGRVTPGPLTMEILRCDGGEYFEASTGSAQFVLQDDKNVYSTKENKCNMLLKHIGGMPFSLTKVVIKAPSDGFDSPIQEGMIFVAMSDDKLLEKTSQYERYSPKNYRLHHPYRRPDYYRPSQEYLNSSRSPLRSIDRSRYLRSPHPTPFRYAENDPELESSLIPGFDVSFFDPSDNEGSPSFTPRSPPSWRDLDVEHSSRWYTDRYRPSMRSNDNRDNASATSSESEDEYVPPYRDRGNNVDANNHDDLEEEFAQQRRSLNQLRMAQERGDHDFYPFHPSRRAQQDWRAPDTSTRRVVPGRIGLRSSASTSDDFNINEGTSSKAPMETTSRVPLSAADVLAPHARFAMTGTQTSIAINFDPPVAGRYILIKLWASCPASNIDIQCIIPYGYGGPRFFPSIEAR